MRDRCVYCGSKSKLTRDHVPPRSLFGTPPPENLITVPACTTCHSGTCKDDEYFVSHLALREEAYQNSHARDATQRFMRSLVKREQSGLRKAFFKNLFEVPHITPAGLYLGKRGGFNVDLVRLSRVAARIVRGLFYHETKNRLPRNCNITAWAEDGLVDLPSDVAESLRQTIVLPLLGQPVKSIGTGTFEYRYQLDRDEPYASGWLLSFYGSTAFLCLTVPASRIKKRPA